MYIINTGENRFDFEPELKQLFAHNFTLMINKNEIIKMRNEGIITDRDMEIVKFLFKMKFATMYQIYNLLNTPLENINLKTRLDKLVGYRVLNKFILHDGTCEEIPKDALEIYCLDLGGRYLLENYSNEDTTDWVTTINMKTSELIAKNLVITEFYLQLIKTCPNKLSYVKIEPELRVGKKNIIPHMEFALKINDEYKYFIVEVVRDYDFPVFVRDKIEKLEGLLKTNAWKKYFPSEESEPILLIVADSDKNALETAKIITETSEIDKYRLTTDERIKKPLYELGAFLKYVPEEKKLQEIKAITFKP